MTKLFKVGVVSKCKSGYKVRFANDMTRVKVLAKTGHTEIELIELPRAMTKPELVTHLKTTALYARAEFKAAIDAADEKYSTVGTVKVSAPSLEAIKARAGVTEAVAE